MAKERIEKIVRKKHKSSRYVAKFDIKKYYPSIKHELLFKYLERDIKNDEVLYLLKTLVGTYSDNGQGLCIGTYLSQYLANYCLSYLYHYITEMLYTERKRKDGTVKRVNLVKYTVFYMDDVIIFSSNKKHIKMAMKKIVKFLDEKLGLELKHKQYTLIDMFKEGAFIDMVGFRIYKNHTTIRRRIYRRIFKDIKALKKYGDNTYPKVVRGMASRHGYVKYSDSRNLKRRLKYNQYFRKARRLISNETKVVLHRKSAISPVPAS